MKAPTMPSSAPMLDRGSTPVPDPTLLTTAALKYEISSLKELLETRLNGMDTAIVIQREDAEKSISKAVVHLGDVHAERFKAVQIQLEAVQVQIRERDVNVERSAKDTKVAVDAALSAQKELANKQADAFTASIAKSETATTKQIDQQGQVIAQDRKAVDERIADLKDRLTRIEGTGKGRGDLTVLIFGGVGMVAGLAGIVTAVLK